MQTRESHLEQNGTSHTIHGMLFIVKYIMHNRAFLVSVFVAFFPSKCSMSLVLFWVFFLFFVVFPISFSIGPKTQEPPKMLEMHGTFLSECEGALKEFHCK